MGAQTNLTILDDSHRTLTEEILPLALKKMKEVLMAKPVRGDPKAKVRMMSLQVRTAIACTNMVIHLGDEALKRRAGSNLDALLEAVRRSRPDLFSEDAERVGQESLLLENEADEE